MITFLIVLGYIMLATPIGLLNWALLRFSDPCHEEFGLPDKITIGELILAIILAPTIPLCALVGFIFFVFTRKIWNIPVWKSWDLRRKEGKPKSMTLIEFIKKLTRVR